MSFNFIALLKVGPGLERDHLQNLTIYHYFSFYVKIFAIKNRAFLLCEFRKLAHSARGVLLWHRVHSAHSAVYREGVSFIMRFDFSYALLVIFREQ